METWNRDELYVEVWERPQVKVAAKYGISAVMLGKVCRKLQIPVPGRGYWAKLEFGKPVERIPLPAVKDLPIMQRLKQQSSEAPPENSTPAPEPTDPEYKRILEIEGRTRGVEPEAKRHKLVTGTAKALLHAKPDERGILQPRWDEACLDIRVSKNSVERALNIVNAVIQVLEAENFSVTVHSDRPRSTAQVFGQNVPFSIVEKAIVKDRREVTEYSSIHTVVDYQPSGELEFRATEEYYGYRKYRDGKKKRLEQMVSQLVGVVLREGRARLIRAEQRRLDEIEQRKKEREQGELAEQIEEEEKKVKDFEGWVDSWIRARQMREFITTLEKFWTEANIDLSPESPKGQRIIWMKRQADRIDPMLESPPSILDRKRELSYR
jgi:hypothetical protein